MSTGLFTGEQVNPDGSTISGGLTFDGSGSNPPKIKASNNVPWIPVGTVCRVVYGLEAASTPRWWCEGFPVDQTFYVQLSQVAGTNPAYTYQVKADDANTVLDSETSATYLLLGSNIEWTSAPTRGIGKYDAAGGFELLYALGTPDDDECA